MIRNERYFTNCIYFPLPCSKSVFYQGPSHSAPSYDLSLLLSYQSVWLSCYGAECSEWEALLSPEQRHEHGWWVEDVYPRSLATPVWPPRYFLPTGNKLLEVVVLDLAEVFIFPQQPSQCSALHCSLERC